MPARKGSGRKPFNPTDDERKMVSQMAAVGIPHEQIAAVTRDGIDADTLKKYFTNELREARIKANAKIGASLYNRAINGDTTAAIFWAKTQMGWRTTDVLDVNTRDVTLLDVLTRANLLQKTEGDT